MPSMFEEFYKRRREECIALLKKHNVKIGLSEKESYTPEIAKESLKNALENLLGSDFDDTASALLNNIVINVVDRISEDSSVVASYDVPNTITIPRFLRQSTFGDSILLHEFMHHLFERWYTTKGETYKTLLEKLVDKSIPYKNDYDKYITLIIVKKLHTLLDSDTNDKLFSHLFVQSVIAPSLGAEDVDADWIRYQMLNEYLSHLIHYVYLRNNGYTDAEIGKLIFTTFLITDECFKCSLTLGLCEDLFDSTLDDRVKYVARYAVQYYGG